MKKYILILLVLSYEISTYAASVKWFDGTHAVSYQIHGKTDPVVTTALQMFVDDMRQVTGMDAVQQKDGTIQIYELDKNKSAVNKLRKIGVPVDSIGKHLDAFYINVYKTENIYSKHQIIIVGNNGRGCAYGLLELSRMAGVSPWVWWADSKPERRSTLSIDETFETLQIPTTEYRGIFLNDEDWSSRAWSSQTFDAQGRKGLYSANAYKHLFQLLLRLRANMIWPGMHEGTVAFYQVPGAMKVADSCGIVIGTSHCEPMMRNNVGEWNKKERGAFNYITNKDGVQQYWTERLKEAGRNENFYTIGMRGIHDSSMEGVGKNLKDKTYWLQTVINDQREMLKKYVNKDLKKIPQQFVPYKEVLAIYENGLQVPDDVMLTWCDDNYGYLTRLPDADQQKRAGGGGIYYHLSYWGMPHDYLWLCSTQPGLIYNEMREAYRHNVRRMWIVNIHEPKVAAYPLELFLDLAWNINSIAPGNTANKNNPPTLHQHLENWLCREFGKQAGEKLLPVMQIYYQQTAKRRPEFMAWTKLGARKEWGRNGMPHRDTEFSLTEFGGELDRYLDTWQTARTKLAEAELLIPQRLKDAFFSHVKYQVLAAAAHSEKMLEAQRARSISMGGYSASRWSRQQTLYTACAKSQRAYQEVRSLTEHWNNVMGGGRWNYSMCNTPRDLAVFQAPRLPVMLTDSEVEKYSNMPNNNSTKHSNGQTSNVIVRNASQYDNAGPNTEIIQMLGHSGSAVALPKGQTLSYRFTTETSDSCVLRTAVIPTHSSEKGDIRYAISIDGGKETVISYSTSFHSPKWQEYVLRQQALTTTPIYMSKGEHTLTIRALDEHVVIDQWMIDFKPDRQFYLFPITEL